MITGCSIYVNYLFHKHKREENKIYINSLWLFFLNRKNHKLHINYNKSLYIFMVIKYWLFNVIRSRYINDLYYLKKSSIGIKQRRKREKTSVLVLRFNVKGRTIFRHELLTPRLYFPSTSRLPWRHKIYPNPIHGRRVHSKRIDTPCKVVSFVYDYLAGESRPFSVCWVTKNFFTLYISLCQDYCFLGSYKVQKDPLSSPSFCVFGS